MVVHHDDFAIHRRAVGDGQAGSGVCHQFTEKQRHHGGRRIADGAEGQVRQSAGGRKRPHPVEIKPQLGSVGRETPQGDGEGASRGGDEITMERTESKQGRVGINTGK